MDKQYSVKFFTSFVEAMQKLCREYLDFDQGVELSGYLAVEIDNFKKERYVLSEMLQSNGSVISESYCTKAFKTLRKEIPRNTNRGSENMIPREHMSRTDRSHSEEVSIVLRQSPETIMHRPNYPIHTTTPRKQMSSHNQRLVYHSNQRLSGSRIRDSSSISVMNPFESSSPSNRGQQREEEQLQIMPRAVEAELKDSWNVSSESNSPHAVVGSPSSTTPRSPSTGGQKRLHPNTESSSSPGPVKKDKVDESLQSLFDAAREIADVSQADIDTMKNNYPSTSQTLSQSTTAASASTITTATTTSTSNSVDENIRLPVEVKLEKEDDIPYMVIDNPSDTEVKTFPGDSMFGNEQDNSAVYSGDQASTSQGSYGDSMHPTDSPGGATWDMGQHKMFMCEDCGSRFASRFTLLRHQIKLHSGVGQYMCHECGKTFSTKDNLEGHRSSEHNAPKRFSCSKCKKEFPYKKNLDYHCSKVDCHSSVDDETDMKDNKLKCDTCQKSFSSKRAIRQHMVTHREPSLVCNICGLKFKWRSSYRKHRSHCHF